MRARSDPRPSYLQFLCLILFSGLLILSGCRTYGNDQYENGPEMYEALQRTVTQLEQELGRAESDLRRLESAAETRSELQPLVERYQSYVESHEAALAGHRKQAEQLSSEASYRELHRVYGAIVTDRRLIQKQYRRATRKVWAIARGTDTPRKPVRDESQYVDTPVNFPQVEDRGSITMTEALRALEGTPGLQRREQSRD
ncbi:MAG: hypothetical protein BRD35_04950 [Bacteroidetes bacterium QH_7_62_13]|nr:MAG: hypothetical protein BRD35_04950 [Bacteroidetes bacterium QH_7_62_13]